VSLIRLSNVAVAALALALLSPPVIAQQPAGVPNALQGFSQNRDQPVQIEAATLEVRDKSGVATFSGNVKVIQGDTTMRCKSLVVYYQGDDKSGGVKAATPGPTGSQSISRLEALGGVIVTQKDQTATGDKGLFDMKTNTVTLSGNVVVSQGKNVMRGERLVVDLTSGVSRVESSKQGPVRMLIQQQPNSSTGGNSAAPGATQKPTMIRPFSQN
jgi:lipopolysaccharide export system protein LptA